jgi:hypothetical protein
MVDLQTIISEAGRSGISLAKLKKTSKLKDADLDDQLKHLRSQLLIAGPVKYGRGFLFYAKGYEPGGDSVAKMIEALIRNSGPRLPTAKQVEEKIKLPFKKFFKDGVRVAVATGRVAELKGGQSLYLLHVDVVRQLFPKIGSSAERTKDDKPSPSFKEQVLSAYQALKAEQGGLSAVSIGGLLRCVGCSKEALHSFLLEEARAGNADLHPTTLVDLNPEDREGALPIPGTTEPAITVTMR